MDLAYILTRKTPKSGGFGGLAHLYVRCPEPRLPAARVPAPALLDLVLADAHLETHLVHLLHQRRLLDQKAVHHGRH